MLKEVEILRLGQIEFLYLKKVYPVYAFLIHTSHGDVLFDTGFSKECILEDEQKTFLGVTGKVTHTYVCEENLLENQLNVCGSSIDKLNCIIISHIHFDHAGGLIHLPSSVLSKVIVHEKEFICSKSLLRYSGEYARQILKRRDKFHVIKDSTYDVYGDGEVVLTLMPGHTDGHMILTYKPSEGDSWMLLGDAVYKLDDLENETFLSSENRINSKESCQELKRMIKEKHISHYVTSHDCDLYVCHGDTERMSLL